jgi:site-specific DNA-cytosine methylase
MFSFITLTPSEYWRILLFKDSFNMAGVRESNPGKVASKWDIAMHLPEAIRQNFVLVVGEFILKVYKHNIKIKLDGGTSAQLAQMNLNNEENRI